MTASAHIVYCELKWRMLIYHIIFPELRAP